jgi:hypothetical protein
MKFVRRTPPANPPVAGSTLVQVAKPATSVVTHATKPAPPAAPSRLRMTSRHVSEYKNAVEEIRGQLKLISESNAQIDSAQENIDAANAKIDALMRRHRLEQVDNGTLIAEITEQFSKQQRTIDPKKFRANVGLETFYACVSVNISKAEEHLSKRAVNEISDIVPSRSLGSTLKIKELGKKKR